MVALSGFADFVSLTAPKIWSDASKFTNNLQRNGYLLPRLLMGREGAASIGGGERIREYLLTKPNNTFRFHSPNEVTPGWDNEQHTDKVEIAYRFAEAHTSYTAQEVDLNEGDPKVTWKRVRDAKMAALWTAVAHGVEDTLFAIPHRTNMETVHGDPGAPNSIPVFVNEQTGGRFGTVTTAIASPYTTDSSIETLARTGTNGWQCATQDYANFDTTSATNVSVAFDRMWLKLRFRSPGLQAKYFEDAEMFRQVILASADGLTKYKHFLRRSNNVLISMQDPAYTRPNYSGIAIEHIPALDTATLYSKVGATTTVGLESEGDITGPRYYWINFNHMKMVWHPKWYMKLLDQFHPERQRTTTIIPVESWFNLFCSSLRHQGIVFPTTDA
jgi:hypothetical protein